MLESGLSFGGAAVGLLLAIVSLVWLSVSIGYYWGISEANKMFSRFVMWMPWEDRQVVLGQIKKFHEEAASFNKLEQ